MLKRTLYILIFLCIGMVQMKAQTDLASLDAIAIESSVSLVMGKLYAGKFEVSNSLYQAFLQEMINLEMDYEYRKSTLDSNGWVRPPDFVFFHLKETYQTSPAFKDYPVVNVSYNGATLFCEWLTDYYNGLAERKYKRVVFRLPSEEEWEIAAKGKMDSAVYSNGVSLKGQPGNFYYNFKTDEGKGSIQNGLAMPPNSPMIMPVNSNEPNGFNLYNMSGNAAEMLIDFGACKGGSFMSPSQELKIETRSNYHMPSPTLGFRYFMFVIEE